MVDGGEPTKRAGMYQRGIQQKESIANGVQEVLEAVKEKKMEMRPNICLHKDLSMF